MKKLGVGLLVALVATMAAPGASPAAGAGEQGEQRSWIVDLEPGADPSAEADQMSRRHGGRAGHVYEHVLGGFQFLGSEQSAASLARNPKVRAVTPDAVVHALEETLPTGVDRIEADAAGPRAVDTSTVRVAVIDTGVDLDHPDLRVSTTLGKNCIDPSKTADDDHGHGSHVAGTIGARDNTIGVIGVAPGVEVVPVKVLDQSGSGTWTQVICGIDHVTGLGKSQVQVANMSLGGAGSAGSCTDGGMHQAICDSVAAGVTHVVAAGNDSKDAGGFVPAAYPQVITVSAFSDTDGAPGEPTCSGRGIFKTCDEVFASFSNYGSVVDVMAPGVSIHSTDKNGGYSTKSGTSMASPHVAGVAALAVAAGKASNPDAVATLLKRTGECPDGRENGLDGPCAGATGDWSGDGESITEPLVHAARAVGDTGGATTPSANAEPTASFTYACTGLTCDFTDTSTDTDGTIAGRSWAFGDGATSTETHPSHTYGAGGTYTVTLTVTDDGGATASSSVPVTVSSGSGESASITLGATGEKVKGTKIAHLSWSGDSGDVDVFRDGARIARGVSAQTYDDESLGKGGGSYVYLVCETASPTTNCSNEATVAF